VGDFEHALSAVVHAAPQARGSLLPYQQVALNLHERAHRDLRIFSAVEITGGAFLQAHRDAVNLVLVDVVLGAVAGASATDGANDARCVLAAAAPTWLPITPPSKPPAMVPMMFFGSLFCTSISLTDSTVPQVAHANGWPRRLS
jgi:hypothetical protein